MSTVSDRSGRVASGVPDHANTAAMIADLREFAERMAEAERIAGFGVWRWELPTGRVLWSDELHRIYGLEPGDFDATVEGFVSLLHPDDRERVWAHIQQALTERQPFVFEERITRGDGEERVLLSQGRPLLDDEGQPTAILGICQDITERRQAERALGLSERRMRAIIDYTPAIVAVKDLDGHYRMINAEAGRVVGEPPDALIGRECAELFPTITEKLRASDRLAAAEMRPVYDEAILVRDGEPRTYLVVTFPLPDERGSPIETCTIATDITERKERDGERRERRHCEDRIEGALREDRMIAYAQPVVALATGRAAFHELLVRMRDPGDAGGLVLPAAFLPAAERYGLIQAVDAWMVERALRLAPEIAPEVNLSAVTLCDPDARRAIIGLLKAAPDAASRLVFEITETAAADHLKAALEFAEALTDLGCGLALDDFGTGFGSFTYLRRLPLRYLKIDASFVTNLVHSRDDERVVQSIVGIAREFDLRTIAEGVEDAAALALITEIGADYAQGFHLGRPAPAFA